MGTRRSKWSAKHDLQVEAEGHWLENSKLCWAGRGASVKDTPNPVWKAVGMGLGPKVLFSVTTLSINL